MNEKKTGLELLREPFPAHQISLLPRPTKKDNPKGLCKDCGGWHGLPAVHLEYIGHAALTDRLLEVDLNWTWSPLALTPEGIPQFDKSGGLWIQLTVCGITRLGYGNAESSTFKEVGSREKEVIGDALRNAGMRFGAALDLWHKGNLHLDEEPKTPEVKPTTVVIPKEQPKKNLPNVTENKAPIGMARSVELKSKIKTQSGTWSNENIDNYISLEFKKQAHELTEAEAMKVLKYCSSNPTTGEVIWLK